MSIRPILLSENGQTHTLIETYENAFKTKTGTENKVSKTHKWKKQDKYQLHQIYPLGTWFVDLVNFGEFWFIFFVEASSRYLIILNGNLEEMENDDFVEVNSGRVKSDKFLKQFKEFQKINKSKITLLIGDSEKAFWSQQMQNYYKKNKISTRKINTTTQGHLGMSILDRLVKTIRDMLHKLKETDPTPDDLLNVVITYNTTYHTTLSNLLQDRITPKEVHEDENLQREINKAISWENFQIRTQQNFILKPGVEVVVKRKVLNKNEKIRTQIEEGTWIVEKYTPAGRYTVKEINSNKILEEVPRSHLRPIF